MRRYLTALLLAAIATPVLAYDLRPARVAKILKDETHELLSIASFECMKARRATGPMSDVLLWNCLPDHKNFASDYANDRWVPSLRGRARKDDPLGLEVQYLLAGVRWPDDPIGLARSNNPIRVAVALFVSILGTPQVELPGFRSVHQGADGFIEWAICKCPKWLKQNRFPHGP